MKFTSATVAGLFLHCVEWSAGSAADAGAADAFRRRRLAFDEESFINNIGGRRGKSQRSFLPTNNDGNNKNTRRMLQQKQNQKRSALGGRPLQNQFLPKQQQQLQVAIGTPKPQECSPDLGILACGGLHEYCISSARSTMGGYCMDFAGSGSVSSSGRRLDMNVNKRINNRRFLEDVPVEDDDATAQDSAGNYNNNNAVGYSTFPGNCTCYPPYYLQNRWEQAYFNYCRQRNDTYFYSNQNCACTNVDRDAYTLSVECANEEFCYDTFNLCNLNYTACSSSTNAVELKGEGTYYSKWCNGRSEYESCFSSYSRVNTTDGTYYSKWCDSRNEIESCSTSTSYTKVDDEGMILFKSCSVVDGLDVCYASYRSNETYLADTCAIEVNGMTCSSCDLVDIENECNNIDGLSYCSNYTYQCFQWDCLNTDWNQTGSSCNSTYYTATYYPVPFYGYRNTNGCDLNCTVCGAAGDGATMTLPDEYFEIPFFGKIKCNNSQTRASLGYLTADGCAAIQQLALDPCGCALEDGGGAVRTSMESTSDAESGMVSASKFVVNLALSFAVGTLLMSMAN